jgi:hypothetical protein
MDKGVQSLTAEDMELVKVLLKLCEDQGVIEGKQDTACIRYEDLRIGVEELWPRVQFREQVERLSRVRVDYSDFRYLLLPEHNWCFGIANLFTFSVRDHADEPDGILDVELWEEAAKAVKGAGIGTFLWALVYLGAAAPAGGISGLRPEEFMARKKEQAA